MGKTVLVVSSFASSLIKFREPLLQSLVLEGCAVHATAPDFDDCTIAKLTEIGVIKHSVSIERNGLNPVADFGTIRDILQLLSKIKPDYVIAYTVKPVIYTGLALRLHKGAKYFPLITGLGFLFQPKCSTRDWLVSKVAFEMYKFAMGKAMCTIFQNTDDRSDLIHSKILSANARTGVVAGSGVCLSQFSYVQPEVQSRGIKFLLIARLIKDKGIYEYIAAAKKIRELYPECSFRLAGWIDSNPTSIGQEELEAWVGHNDIEFLGKLEDVRSALENCDVYVLPSYREGTPRTVLEAMAIGRPIVTTDAPGCRETVEEGVNGFMVPVKDVDSIVTAMLRFVHEPELVVKMGKQSRLIAEAKFDSKKVASDMLKLMGIKKA